METILVIIGIVSLVIVISWLKNHSSQKLVLKTFTKF